MIESPALVLASASPRRAELLASLGLSFTVDAADVDEAVAPGEPPLDYVLRVARAKAEAVAERSGDAVVLAADTTVVLDGAILGKPADPGGARSMLRSLSGRTHQVITAVVVRGGGRELVDVSTTSVSFDVLTGREIDWYVATGEPLDKAGAYGIQGVGGAFVTRVDGNVQNVIGLSLTAVRRLLADAGISVPGASSYGP